MGLEIKYTGFDGREHKANLVPLKQKPAMLLLHRFNLAIAGVLASMQSKSDMKGALEALSPEMLWSMAEELLTAALIDNHEVKRLEDFEPLMGHVEDLYILVFEAMKANYPDFFRQITGRFAKFFAGETILKSNVPTP